MKKSNLFLLLIFIPFIAFGQIAERTDSVALAHASEGFNGNILYSRNDSIIFTGNYGYRNFETKQPLNDNTIFDIGSNTKQFTALAIVQLVEKGLLTDETKVDEIIDEFPYSDITVEHLLRHQSGLPKYQEILYDKNNWDRKEQATNQDLLNILSELKPPLNFEPGTEYQYSNTGYVILASIIEQLSGQSYANYIQEHIFKPAGMQSSKVQRNGTYLPDIQNIATGYTLTPKSWWSWLPFIKEKGRYQKVEEDENHEKIHWMSDIVGGRGIFSSPLDLEKWKQAVRTNKLISKESKLQMFSVDSVSTRYGYCFAIYETESKGKWVYHNGSWAGWKTMVLYLPESNEYLVILSNNRYEETHNKFEEDLYKVIQ
jgi:CubicO group peptidase (beta-lactamase class C family)